MPCTQPSVSERIMNSSRRQICGQSSKKRSRKNSTISKIVHINAKTKTATPLINTGAMAVFGFIKCQRWDHSCLSFPPQPLSAEVLLLHQIFSCKATRIIRHFCVPQAFLSQVVLPVYQRHIREFLHQKLLVNKLI